MLVEKYEKELKVILNALEYIIDCVPELDDENDFCELAYDFQYKCPYKCSFANGATKGVIIFKDLGFVIKVPLMYYDGGSSLYGAGGDDDWNYCEAELKNYIAAKENNVENCFAKIEFIKQIGGCNYPVYIQEYVDTFVNRSSVSYHTDEDVDMVRQIINQSPAYDYIDTNWEADILATFGKNFYEKVKEFIFRYEINDLHRGNIGYINCKPVFADYSGFNA